MGKRTMSDRQTDRQLDSHVDRRVDRSYKGQTFEAIELIEPKEGQNPKSGLEHAEFLLPVSLEEYIQKYPDINWNTDAINREEFPMLILRLSEDMQVKFPRHSIL